MGLDPGSKGVRVQWREAVFSASHPPHHGMEEVWYRWPLWDPLGESLLSSSRSLLVLLDVTAQVPRMESTYLPRRAGADQMQMQTKGAGRGVGVARMEIERWIPSLLEVSLLEVNLSGR